jgi:hypothetical protein
MNLLSAASPSDLATARIRTATALACGILVCTGCATPDPPPPPNSPLSAGDAVVLGVRVAQNDAGRQATLGRGGSMQPVYADGTVIVVQPIDFADLEAGMTVAYRNQAGQTIVHVLIRREPDGWVAQGLNNPEPDPERVTVDNLLGVVYGVIHSAPPP